MWAPATPQLRRMLGPSLRPAVRHPLGFFRSMFTVARSSTMSPSQHSPPPPPPPRRRRNRCRRHRRRRRRSRHVSPLPTLDDGNVLALHLTIAETNRLVQ